MTQGDEPMTKKMLLVIGIVVGILATYFLPASPEASNPSEPLVEVLASANMAKADNFSFSIGRGGVTISGGDRNGRVTMRLGDNPSFSYNGRFYNDNRYRYYQQPRYRYEPPRYNPPRYYPPQYYYPPPQYYPPPPPPPRQPQYRDNYQPPPRQQQYRYEAPRNPPPPQPPRLPPGGRPMKLPK